MSTHWALYEVQVQSDEMDGSPEESAEVFMDLVHDLLRKHWGRDDLHVHCKAFGASGEVADEE